MNPSVYWYLARAGGLTAWCLLWASIVWGLLLSTRLGGRRPGAAWLLDLHRFLGGTAVVFVALHVGGLMMDRFVSFGPADVFVPFASSWRPGAVAWGVVAGYLVAAIEATSLLRRWLPRRWWHRVHETSFVVFGCSAVHAFSAGSDHGNVVVQWSAIAMAAVVVFLTTYRAFARPSGPVRVAADPSSAGPAELVAAGRVAPERQE